MADTDLTVYTLGQGGVDVDLDPVLTAPNETLQSQNATYDPTAQHAGGLTKRKGLDRFNTVPFGGIVLGGIEAAYSGTAGAPLSGGGGGGLPGDPGGANGGQPAGVSYGVGPGSTITIGTTASTGTAPSGGGASVFTSGSVLFGGKKLIVVGRTDSSNNGSGSGWYLTSKGFADFALKLTGPGPPMNGYSASDPPVTAGALFATTPLMCARPNALLFYAGIINAAPVTTVALTVLPTIHRNDGITDTVCAQIPVNPLWPQVGGTYSSSIRRGMQIIGMTVRYGDGGHIFVAVMDRNTTSGTTTADGCRIFRMDTSTFALTEIFNSLNTNYNAATGTNIGALVSGGGIEAWFGLAQQTASGVGVTNALVATSGAADGYANWQGYEGAFTDPGDVTCVQIFKGGLYIGRSNTASGAAFAKCVVNQGPFVNTFPGGATGTVGTLTATGGSAVQGNYFPSMCVFQNKLYVSFYNDTQSCSIYQTDGNSWTNVYTTGSGNALQPYTLAIDSDGDILYAFGGRFNSGSHFMTSTDGVTWIDQSANMSGGIFSNNQPHNVFFDITQ